VAPNKFLAKIASGWRKPDGLTVISPERVEPFLQKLPVDALWGVGPVTARRLRAHGLERLVHVRRRSLSELQALVGSMAPWLVQLAHGIDDRPVEPNRPRKSVGTENTFARDLVEIRDVHEKVGEMAREVGDWLVRKGMFARTITLKVRYNDFTTVTRSHSERVPTQSIEMLVSRALALIDRTECGRRPVRLLGVSAHNLTDGTYRGDEVDRGDGRLPLGQADPA
jgi:DNA polymerase-4